LEAALVCTVMVGLTHRVLILLDAALVCRVIVGLMHRVHNSVGCCFGLQGYSLMHKAAAAAIATRGSNSGSSNGP